MLTMNIPLKIYIILGSTREGRKGETVARWVYDYVKTQKDIQVKLIDLRDYPMPFYEEPLPSSMLNGNIKNPIIKKWLKKVEEADAYIIVTPEYNHSFPAVLKNALDYPYSEWNKKPVGFVSYGGSANGARAVEQLRLIAIELQMAAIRAGVHISMMQKPFDEQGKMSPAHYDHYTKALQNLLDQLLWWGNALKAARSNK